MWSLFSAAFPGEKDALGINGTYDGGLRKKKCDLMKKKKRKKEELKEGRDEERKEGREGKREDNTFLYKHLTK